MLDVPSVWVESRNPKHSITMAAGFLPATSLRLTPYSTLRFLSFFPISTTSHSLFRPLRRRVLPLFDTFPANARRRCFCTAVSESLGSGEGNKVENHKKRFGSKIGEFRRKLRIAEVKGGADEGLGRVGQSLNIMGWVRTLRSQSSLTFIEINDGSCLSNLQCVMNSDAEGYDQVESGSILTGASVSVQGTIVASQGTKQKVELKVEKIIVVGKCDSSYPIQKKRVSREFLRTKAHLRPRTNTFGAVARVRNTLAFATHKFFQESGFVWVASPIITASDCEGAGEQFCVKATTILRRMLAERRIGSFQVENHRNKEKLDKTLKGLCVTGRLKEAVGLLWRSGLQVEPETYAVLLQECKQRKEYTKGKRIHAQMVVVGFAPNEYLKVKLLILYALSGDLQTAGIIFRSLQIRDLIPWNAMISGYVQKGLELEGLYIYFDMRQNRIVPDQYTFASVFRACSALASLEHGMRAHAVMIKCHIKSNIIVNSALVDMYFKCSSFSDGQKVFDQLSTRNVITWTSLMSGYGYHGKVSEVLKCFDKMKEEGCRPNPVTFLVVLTACNHGGLVEEGWVHFDSMKREYGIEPEGQHYAAMVDMLGRAGKLQEAYEFVMESPCKKHAPVWGSLLGACRIHGNVKMLELAATEYFELDQTNGGNYVVFANGYASCGFLDASSKVRRKMENAGVKKDPGHSLIELQGEVHRFMKDDMSHRLSAKVYKKVQEMTSVFLHADYYQDDLDASCPV